MSKLYAGITYEDAVLRYANDITRICILQVKNPEDAKDCFQNVFLKLYLTTTLFSNQEHLKAWLIRVAFNECHDYHRSFWKRSVDLGYPKEGQEMADPQDPFRRGEDCILLVEQLRRLPARYRQVLYLYYYEEYTTPEIAGLLGVSVNTVKSRLQRGRSKLAQQLKDDDT